METALRCGIEVAAFWDMTPRETLMSIDAAIWRTEHDQKRDVALAWHTAALTRAKKMPRLASLLKQGPAKPLHGEELETRRREFKDLASRVDVAKLNERMKR